MEQVAFLPHLQESIMDELRTTEGMLFRDESTKKLFLDIKSLVIDTLTERKDALHLLLEWDSVSQSEVARSLRYGDIADRLTSVTVLYAKYLYAKNNPDPINIKKPRVESLLRGMYSRLARMPTVRSGAFFELDPLRQDFVIRDVFRQALANDCIVIIEKTPQVLVEPEEKEDEEIYPDDSISAVMARAEHKDLANFEPMQELREEPYEIQAPEKSVVTHASAASKATRITCVMPTNVKRIVLTGEESP